MAHFAKLNDSNEVVAVHVVNNDALDLENEEQSGIELLISIHGDYRFVQTSYNNNIRGTYAGIGYSYNAAEDIFITPQPYPSWIRTGSFWDAPTPMPTDGAMYSWVEADLNWQLEPTE